MAADEHKASRRAVLGAAVALPLLGRGTLAVGTTPGPADANAWREALATFERAEADVHEFERRSRTASHQEQLETEDAYGDLLDLMLASLRRLLSLPAPDLDALATKVALVTDYEAATLTGGEACMETLKRDARWLAAALD